MSRLSHPCSGPLLSGQPTALRDKARPTYSMAHEPQTSGSHARISVASEPGRERYVVVVVTRAVGGRADRRVRVQRHLNRVEAASTVPAVHDRDEKAHARVGRWDPRIAAHRLGTRG
jgi:hypothetical protein